MSTKTEIEFTHHTSSPWWGCSKVHSGCYNCYAETMDARFKGGNWGPNTSRKLIASFGENCRKWNRQAEKSCERRRVFLSMCDPFEQLDEAVNNGNGGYWFSCPGCSSRFVNRAWCPECRSRMDYLSIADLRRDMFATIDACPNLDFLLFTKRPENIPEIGPHHSPEKAAEQWGKPGGHNAALYRPNVWLVTSVSTQKQADKMIPQLLQCRHLVPVLGVSYEPALGPIDFTPWLTSSDGFVASDNGPIHVSDGGAGLDWIVAGGESGPGARPAHPDWFRSVRDQCAEVALPFFFKQWGGVQKKKTGRLLDGVEHNGMPLTADRLLPTNSTTENTER